MSPEQRKKQNHINFLSRVGEGKNIDYDFTGEAEMVARCQCGELLHADGESCPSREVPSDD